MPVKLEIIRTPDEADLNDIRKIRQETSPQGFTCSDDGLETFLAAGGWIWAGRFNDRIVGVLLAEPQEQRIILSQAGVRQITQRRGVMHQMLQLIQQQARNEGLTLELSTCPNDLRETLFRRGFQQIDDKIRYN
ncbi:MAG: PanM family protein [Pseudomonadota bacterium]|nr:PanM family protein [Pseudomonadota bacterium]